MIRGMADSTLHDQINDLVERERELRAKLAAGEIDIHTEHVELAELEVHLDQLWDLLRQRDARREFGQDAARAAIRPAAVVENYES